MNRAIRLGPVSVRWRPRHVIVLLITTLAAVVTAVVSAGIGEVQLTPQRVLEVIGGDGTRREDLVILTIRVPRILVGLLVGAALGISGALVQGLARNPLASPDLLGITAGASLGAVSVIVLGGDDDVSGVLATVGVPFGALLGGLLAAVLVFAICRRAGTHGLQPILVGIGVSAMLGGLVSWLMVKASINEAARANVWLTGSLNGRSWTELWPLLVTLVVVSLALVPLSARVPALHLGDDLARGLGTAVRPVQAALLFIAVLLAAVATSVTGPIAFVALVAPHLSRLASSAPRAPLAASGATGACLVVVSDLVARTALAPLQLPVGPITAIAGAPFLLWLLVRERNRVT